MSKALYLGAASSLIALIMLCLAWELALAPLRPGGSWMVIKAILLLLPLFGILRGKRYTYQWSCMFILLYFTEGIMRAWSESGTSQGLAMVEIALSSVFFCCTIFYAKLTHPGAAS